MKIDFSKKSAADIFANAVTDAIVSGDYKTAIAMLEEMMEAIRIRNEKEAQLSPSRRR